MISSIISRLVILIFGTLYPAYASYKAVRTKNLKEYVKWMMYWIVFALFTCTETFTDVFLSWFPFYYEVKIVLVLWLLSPATKGSSILYRKFVHPALCRREQEIDEYIAKAKDQGYHTVLNLGTKGVNYATTVIMQTAIKNLNLPSPEQDREPRARRAIEPRDVTDGGIYEDIEFPRPEVPGMVEIMELDSETPDHIMGAGDPHDPDYEPDDSPARSRGNVARKRKTAKADKEKKPRSRSRGRRTRSQTAQDKELMGGGGLVQQIRKSYSLSDLTECEPREERGGDEADDVLTEPRLIRRGGKSGFTTRRSASESNSRSPMYFPEVDVDVRPRARTDEPDFSHIKSSEDISSGYSSADNSASLTRTASVGAAARSRGRTTRTAVTSIKRPPAAEGNEVIIEELHDSDSFEYANMPPLVNFPPPLYLSNTQPPFIYQFVGDQVKILQVLSNSPSNTLFSNQTDNYTDHRDQKETISDENVLNKSIDKECLPDLSCKDSENIVNESEVSDIPAIIEDKDNNDVRSIQHENVEPTIDVGKESINSPMVEITNSLLDETGESTSLDTLQYDNASVDSDDEASFGTPEHSPKTKRKSPKGKYGKSKAPLPPVVNTIEAVQVDNNDVSKVDTEHNKDIDISEFDTETTFDSTTSQESLVDILSKLPNSSIKQSGFKGLQVVNPIAENKRRHKSKSPVHISKTSSSGLGKLLQLPTKLAFWHKSDDKTKADNTSLSSGDRSRRSSLCDRLPDEFQSCAELHAIVAEDIKLLKDTVDKLEAEKADDKIDVDIDSELISQDIINKSDALQKLIEAKIESHPEYKRISLHEEIPTQSKSTDV